MNLNQPATTYANWFSYESPEFINQNREIEKAFRITRALFSRPKLRFVGDAGLDDQKVFAQVDRVQGEFVIRGCHDRGIEVYNPRRHRWEREKLFDLVATISFEFEHKAVFTHAGKTWRVRMGFGWLHIRLPDTLQELWVLAARLNRVGAFRPSARLGCRRPPRGNPGTQAAAFCGGAIGGSIYLLHWQDSDTTRGAMVTRAGRQTGFEK